MKDTKKITFNGEEFEVKKIPLRRFGELALSLDNLPNAFKMLFQGENNQDKEINTQAILDKAPQLLFELGETLPKFLSVASNIELEKVLDGGLDDTIVLLDAVLEINNLEVIIKHLKNFRKVLPS